MRRPIAAAYLGRIAHMTGEGSLARAQDERGLGLRAEDELERRIDARLRLLAREDRALHEGAVALLRERGWPLDKGVLPYGWNRLRGARLGDALAEILRILAREVFELEGFARELQGGVDDEVASLALEVACVRRSVRKALVLMAPEASLPGAK